MIAIFTNIFLLTFLDTIDLILGTIIAIIAAFFAFWLLIYFLSDYIKEIKKL